MTYKKHKKAPWQWEMYTLKMFPKKINDNWYKPGDTVYRYFCLGPGGGFWRYGELKDVFKDIGN
jgi:hypothetical protein